MKKQWSIYSFSICLLLLTACEEDKNTIPQDVLQPDHMSLVLKDIHLAEVDVLERKLSPDSSHLALEQLYYRVFDIHEISKEQFLRSYNYYIEHPKKLKEVYQDVIEDLNLEEEQMLEDHGQD